MPKILFVLRKLCAEWLEFLLDIFVPEDKRIARLLNGDFEKIRTFLPESRVRLKNINVLFDYQSRTVKSLVHLLKFKNNMRVRKFFALCIFDTLTTVASDSILFENRRPIIVPMPMSKKEYRERSFNQTEELLREVDKIAGDSLDIRYTLLEKTHDTPRQTHLGREERRKNIRHSMRVKNGSENDARDQIFIIIDDVYTTGATFEEASRAVKGAGAKDCIGVFLAH